MKGSSRTSNTGWSGAAGSFSINASQGDSRQRPSRSAADGTLMDLVASSSRSRPPPSPVGLSPRSAEPSLHASVPASAWNRNTGAATASQAPLSPAPQGSWRSHLGSSNLMSVGAESAARSERPPSHAFGAAGASRSGQAAMQTAEPGAWRSSLGRGEQTGVGAASAWLQERPQSHTEVMVSFGGPRPSENVWPSHTAAGPGSLGQPATLPVDTGFWPSSSGGGDLLDLVASAGRSERPQSYTAAAAPSAGAGLNWNAGSQPTAAGFGSAGQSGMPPLVPGSWPSDHGGGDLMSVVAASARPSERQHVEQSGWASSMWPGQVGGAAQSSGPFEAPGASSSASSRKRPPPDRISAEDFDKMVSLIESGKSARRAREAIGRMDLPESTVRYWMTEAGIDPGSRIGRRPSLSAAQIEEAMRLHASYISDPGNSKQGSVRATYEAMNDKTVGWGSFRDYFNKDGLSKHGWKMLERARQFESGESASRRQDES